MMKITTLIKMDQDAIQEVNTFVGAGALEMAKAGFETWTGVSYDDYLKRRNGVEDDSDILGEDHAGSTIYEGVAQEAPDPEFMDSVELAQTLVLSTAHVSRKVCFELLQKQYEQTLIVYKKGNHGYWIHVPETIAEELPACLQEIFKLAYRVDAQWVMLDCDGPLHAALPRYYW